MARKLVLDRFLPYRLSVASNIVSSRIAEAYRKRFGLKIAEWRLIAILAEQASLTPAALGEATRMDKITVSRAAAALLDRGLLKADENPDDGRSHLLALTRDGLQLYGEIAPLALATERTLFADFSASELAIFDALLRRIADRAHD